MDNKPVSDCKSLEEVKAVIQTFATTERDFLLARVDQLERMADIKPRTAELRSVGKQVMKKLDKIE